MLLPARNDRPGPDMPPVKPAHVSKVCTALSTIVRQLSIESEKTVCWLCVDRALALG